MILLLIILYLGSIYSDSTPYPVIYVNSSSGVNSSECWEGDVTKPCLTFNLGLQGLYSNKQGTLLVAEGNYSLSNNFTDFYKMNNGPLSIQGVVPSTSLVPSVTVTCVRGVGLAFTHVTKGISIGGIRFVGCGALRNTTSYNMNDTHPAFFKIHVGIYFLYCFNINISMIEVRDTPGTGMIIYNTVGDNLIHNSTFIHNNFQPGERQYSGGGGVSIEFTYCDILTSANCLNPNEEDYFNEYANYLISESYFLSNYANLYEKDADSDSFLLPNGRYHVAMGRGGGLSVFFLGKANGNKFIVTDCTIADNRAIWAGGLLVEYHDSALNNVFILNNTRLRNNSVYNEDKNQTKLLASGTGGGGARVAMFDFNSSYILNNSIIFVGCTFEQNLAYYGGGVSFYTTTTNVSNSLQFESCEFKDNTARLGAGIDISLFHMGAEGHKPSVVISNCQFLNNTAKSNLRSVIGAGTIYIDTITVRFTGSISFNNNSGTALTVTNAYIEVYSHCSMNFTNNSGRYGGGVSLLGFSYIMTNPNSTFFFYNNSADFSGGAIYYYSSGERDLVGSGNCFIRYSNWHQSREKWETSFKFESNSANGEPNSIYASTVLPCIHGGEDWNIGIGADRVFCWSQNWIYNGTSNNYTVCHSQIKTAATRYEVKKSYSVIPGDMFNLNASVYDDYNNSISGSTLFSLKIKEDTANVSFQEQNIVNHDFTSHGRVRLYGQPNSKTQIQIETLDPIVIPDEFKVTLLECPPGYHIPNTSDSSISGRCQCESGDYNGYIRCKDDNFTSSIVRTGWIGEVNGQLLAGGSPYISNISKTNIHVTLPQDISQLNEFFCNQSHSNGTLCGSCQDGYGVPAATFEFMNIPCLKCKSSPLKWVYYILAGFIPTLLFFCFVFIFTVSVTSGPLNSFIFFAQIISVVAKIDADGMIPLVSYQDLTRVKNFYDVIYSFWNMKFFDLWLLDFCISPHLNSLDILLLGYTRAIFPLILLICVFSIVSLYNRGVPFIVCLFRPLHRCLARFRQFSNLRKSVIGGIAVFIVISYTQITLISLLVLTPAELYNSTGYTVKTVFYYDGDINYVSKHFRYFIAPILALCVFIVAPPILLAYPSLLKLVSFLSCRRVNVDGLFPSPKLQALLGEFHDCYKDGSDGGNDCRWFASLYFILRVGLVTIYTTTSTWHMQYTEQIFLFLFVALLFAVFRPYRNDWINVLDTAMFLLLAGISTLSFYNLTNTWIGIDLNVNVVIIQQLIMGIPLIYCIIYCCIMMCVHSVKPCLKRNRSRIMKSFNAISSSKVDQTDDIPHDREGTSYASTPMFEDSTHVSDFLDFVEDSGRYSTTNARSPMAVANALPNTNSSINSSVDESTRLLDKGESGRDIVKP